MATAIKIDPEQALKAEEIYYELYVDLSEGSDFVEGTYLGIKKARDKVVSLISQGYVPQAIKDVLHLHPISSVEKFSLRPVFKNTIN